MIKNKVLLSQSVFQVEGNIVSDMDGEKVMLNVENGKYFNLGEVGGVIWDRIKEPIVINELITYLISEYEVDQAQCEEQVLTFLEGLQNQGLIQIG